MPSKRYALEEGGKPRLLLRWSADWSDFTASVDGAEIGRIEGGRQALEKAPLLVLPEGGAIKVELVPGVYTDSVRASRGGRPLPINDPHARIRQVSLLFLAFGVLALLIGALGVLVRAAQGPPGVLNLASVTVVLGLVYIGLGYSIRRWRSGPALGLACGIFLAIVAADWATRSSFDAYQAVVGAAMTILIVWQVWRGFTAISDAKQLDMDEPQHATDAR